MKKIVRIVVFCASVMCLLLFFSCGTKPAEKPSDTTADKIIEKPIETTEPTKPSEQIVDEGKTTEPEKSAPVVETLPEVKPFTKVNFAEDLKKSLASGTTQDALTMFENVPEEYKDDYNINYMQAALLVSSGDTAKASEAGEKLLAENPDNVDVLILNAMIAKQKGDSETKSELLKKVIALDPNNSDALLELGHEQLMPKSGRPNYKVARRYYERSVKADENQLDGWLGVGQTSYFLRDDNKAKQAFETIIKKDPSYSMAYAYLAKLKGEDEKYLEASKLSKQAIDIDPDYFDYWVDYGHFLQLCGKLKESEEALDKAIELNPNNFLSYVYRASTCEQLGKFDKAASDYRAIIKLKPSYQFAYESLGIIEFKKGNWTNARLNFLEAMKRNEKNISYKLMVAATYIAQKNKVDLKKFLDTQMRNLDRSSAEYLILRYYLDGIQPSQVDIKIRKEQNTALRGKYLFYMGLYYSLNGNDEIANKYYSDVLEMHAPMIFEYQMAEWIINGEVAPLFVRKN